MATYNGVTTNQTGVGDRLDRTVSPTYADGYESNLTLRVAEQKNGFVRTSIRDGNRVHVGYGYIANMTIGTRLKAPIIQTPSTFELLKEEGLGSRIDIFAIDGILVAGSIVDFPIRIVGRAVSSVGIDYVPETIPGSGGQKEIRRWPRDWHGDNMKN